MCQRRGKAALGHPSLITHLCSLAGVDIFVPQLEKATHYLDFSYFQRFCSVAPRPKRRHQPQAEPELEPEPEAAPNFDMRLQALVAKLDHLQLLEPHMQALYQLGMANADMLRGISLTILELHTPSAEEFAAIVAWPKAHATTTGEVEPQLLQMMRMRS